MDVRLDNLTTGAISWILSLLTESWWISFTVNIFTQSVTMWQTVCLLHLINLKISKSKSYYRSKSQNQIQNLALLLTYHALSGLSVSPSPYTSTRQVFVHLDNRSFLDHNLTALEEIVEIIRSLMLHLTSLVLAPKNIWNRHISFSWPHHVKLYEDFFFILESPDSTFSPSGAWTLRSLLESVIYDADESNDVHLPPPLHQTQYTHNKILTEMRAVLNPRFHPFSP